MSYGNGRLHVYPLGKDGVPGKSVATVDEGINAAHCVLVSPDNRNLYIPYVKGNLALLQYGYNGDTAITALEPKDARPPQGTARATWRIIQSCRWCISPMNRASGSRRIGDR